MFLSALLFSAMGIFVKKAAEMGIPAFQLVFMRAGWQGCFVLPALIMFKVPRWFGEGELRPWIIGRGILGGIGFCSYFLTIALLPIGDAICLCSLYPVVTVVIARIVLKEAMTVLKTLAIVLCAAGAVLVAQPTFIFGHKDDEDVNDHPYRWIGYFTALAGSFLGGVLFVVMRRAKQAHVLQLLWSWVVGSVCLSLILANTVTHMVKPSTEAWGYIIGMCVTGMVGHFMMNYSGRLVPAGPSSLLRSSDVVFAYIWEFTIFGEAVNLVTITGVVMILVGIVLVAVNKMNQNRLRHMRSSAEFKHIATEELDIEEELELEDKVNDSAGDVKPSEKLSKMKMPSRIALATVGEILEDESEAKRLEAETQ